MEMTERIIGLVAVVIVASAGIAAYILLAARRKKAKKTVQTQALLGTVYKNTPTQTKKVKK